MVKHLPEMYRNMELSPSTTKEWSGEGGERRRWKVTDQEFKDSITHTPTTTTKVS